MHDTWVRLELDPGRCDDSPELLSCQGSKPNRYHGVQLPMALKDGQVLGAAIGCLWARQNFQGKVSATCSMVPKPQGPSGDRGGAWEDTHLREVPVQRQPAAQCYNASQRVGAGKCCIEGQGPTLGEENDRSGKKDTRTPPLPLTGSSPAKSHPGRFGWQGSRSSSRVQSKP